MANEIKQIKVDGITYDIVDDKAFHPEYASTTTKIPQLYVRCMDLTAAPSDIGKGMISTQRIEAEFFGGRGADMSCDPIIATTSDSYPGDNPTSAEKGSYFNKNGIIYSRTGFTYINDQNWQDYEILNKKTLNDNSTSFSMTGDKTSYIGGRYEVATIVGKPLYLTTHLGAKNSAGSNSTYLIRSSNYGDKSVTPLSGFVASSSVCVDASEYICATGFKASSDLRLKENIKDYVPQNSILDLPIKEFDYRQSKHHTIGCIAQDLQELFPALVGQDDDGYLRIEENKLVYLCLLEIKKLKEEIDELKKGM